LPAITSQRSGARDDGDEYAQEFECSFEASVKGAIYAKEIEALRVSGPAHQCPV
jgi:hypothetical protein